MTDPIKQITITPAVTALVKDVFGPSAKLLGSELKSFLKAQFDEAKERRRSENLGKHITAVRETLTEPPPENVSYKNLELFSDWVEGAQDIGEEDAVLTQMWREVLHDIVQNRKVSKSLIDLMKQVDAPMADLLIALSRVKHSRLNALRSLLNPLNSKHVDEESYHNARRLESLGLIETDQGEKVFVGMLFGVPLAGLIAALAPYFLADLQTLLKTPSAADAPVIWRLVNSSTMILIWLIMTTYALTVMFKTRSYRLTWTGRELVKYASANCNAEGAVGNAQS